MWQHRGPSAATHRAATQDNTPLHVAALVGSLECVRIIVEAGGPWQDARAAMLAQLDAVAAAAVAAASPRSKSAAADAMRTAHADPAHVSDRCVRLAAGEGHWDIVALCLQHGFTVVPRRPDDPLLAAVRSGQPQELLSALVLAGADAEV